MELTLPSLRWRGGSAAHIGFGERFLTAAVRGGGEVEGWEKNEDKRPNKVCLNIEAAGHFSLVLIKSCWWILVQYPPRCTEH